jgi:thiamine pyrophosphate-dependent acetolactate synthase large subunit-like protein
MSATRAVDGHVSGGFEAVRRAFIDNITRRGELGGAERASGYAYVTSKMGTTLTGDPREVALRNALYSALPTSSGASGRRVA